MKGDYSRFSFDPTKHYRAVLMQQGRLQLDADWNEQVQMAEHRYSAFFRSLVGRSGTPKEKEMKLVESGDGLNLTNGIYYIDGLLIENESLSELKKPTKEGIYLYYIDAWTREVTAAEDDALIDPAVGVETTTRLKTEWKVCYAKINNVGEKLRNEYLAGEWPGASSDWKELAESGDWWQPLSTGKLKIVPKDSKSESIDVDITDNRLYRVEVHETASDEKGATFKWSRDNASVCAEVVIGDNSTLKLKNNNENIRNAFKGAALIELCTSPYEAGVFLNLSDLGNPFDVNGVLQFTQTPGGISPLEDISRSLQVDAGLPSSKATRTMIVRRWDGSFSKNDEKNSLQKELGINFSCSGGKFYRSGDYWLVFIRDGKVVNWTTKEDNKSDGIEHHFAALGVISVGNARAKPILLHLAFDPLTSPNLSTSNDVKIRGDLTVRNLFVESNADIAGNTTINRNLEIHGHTYTEKSLTVDGYAHIEGDLATGGDTYLGGRLEVGRGLFVTGANTEIEGCLFVGDELSVGYFWAAGNEALMDNLTANNASIEENLEIFGHAYIEKSLSVDGYAYIDDDLAVGGDMYMQRETYMESNAFVSRDLEVGGDLDVNCAHIGGELDVDYVYIRGELDVDSEIRVQGDSVVTMQTIGDLFRGSVSTTPTSANGYQQFPNGFALSFLTTSSSAQGVTEVTAPWAEKPNRIYAVFLQPFPYKKISGLDYKVELLSFSAENVRMRITNNTGDALSVFILGIG